MSWDFSGDGPNQQFGKRPRNGGEWHYGRDYGTKGKEDVPLGVPKYCDGWICHVLENNKIDGLGNQVVLIHPDGTEMVRFGHIETGTMNHLKTGQIMNYGDWIGNVGGVGYTEHSFQLHIHVEHGINPSYELVQTKHNNKYYRHYQWVCGEQMITDYRDPNEKALPFSELEELTDMAFKSREAILNGRGRKVQMSGVMPVDLVKKDREESSFSAWFRSTWIGSLFYSDDKDEEENDYPSQQERTGPIIHRKPPVSTEQSASSVNEGMIDVLSRSGQISVETQQSLVENQNHSARKTRR